MAMVGGILAALIAGKMILDLSITGRLPDSLRSALAQMFCIHSGLWSTGLVAGGFFVWLFVWCSTQKKPTIFWGFGHFTVSVALGKN